MGLQFFGKAMLEVGVLGDGADMSLESAFLYRACRIVDKGLSVDRRHNSRDYDEHFMHRILKKGWFESGWNPARLVVGVVAQLLPPIWRAEHCGLQNTASWQ